MRLRIFVSATLFCSMGLFTEQGFAAGDPDPLFASHDALTVRIKAPFNQIMKLRPVDKDGEVDGIFAFVDADGSEHEFDVKIRTRGNNRRDPDTCSFAPLRLNFKKGDLDDTLFDKQDKLKLVTHCQNNHTPYRQSVVREYLAYRILNALTDYSFRVRLLNIKYVYSDDDDQERESYAFLIESKDRLGKRLGLKEQDVTRVKVEQLDREYTNLTSVFEYLIGNLDFSPVLGASDQPCCHNFAVFSADNETYWSIPYDFDRTGLAAPPHAGPNPKYRQNNIRQRIYRGRCYNNAFLPSTFQKFQDNREVIEALVAGQAELIKSHRRSVTTFIEKFYKALAKEDKLIEEFEKACID